VRKKEEEAAKQSVSVEADRFDRKQGYQCCELFSNISLFNLVVFQE
jgi:hypothetical protein